MGRTNDDILNDRTLFTADEAEQIRKEAREDAAKIVEKSFLKKLQKAYTEYDAECLKEFLAEDVTYDSIWVIEQITNKSDYINYLEHKLEAMKNNGIVINFIMMYEQGNGRPHLIFTPKNKGTYGCFTIETDYKFIKSIHLTPSDFYSPLVYKDKEKYERFLEKEKEYD